MNQEDNKGLSGVVYMECYRLIVRCEVMLMKTASTPNYYYGVAYTTLYLSSCAMEAVVAACCRRPQPFCWFGYYMCSSLYCYSFRGGTLLIFWG